MEYHEKRLHPSFKPDGTAANFILNGLPRKPGAPFADPCIATLVMPSVLRALTKRPRFSLTSN